MRKLMLGLSALAAIGVALPFATPADAAKARVRMHSNTPEGAYARVHRNTYQGEGRSLFRREPQPQRRIHQRTFTHD